MKYKIVILSLTIFFCIWIGFQYIDNSDRNEWFSLGVLTFYVLGLIILYLIGLLILGLIFKGFKKSQIASVIFKMTGISSIFLIITFLMVFIKSNLDFNKWQTNSQREWKTKELNETELILKQIDSVNLIIRNDSSNYKAFVQRGILKRHLGKFDSSIVDYQVAIRIKPDDFDANLELGFALNAINKKNEAEKYYRIAANIDTSSYFAKQNPQYIERNKKNGR